MATAEDEIIKRLDRIETKVDLVVVMQNDIKWLKRTVTGAWVAILGILGVK
jgi:hypothetical protein